MLRFRIFSMVLCAGLLLGLSGGLRAETNGVSAGYARCTTPLAREGKAHERFLLLNERVKEAGSAAELIFVGDSITQGWEVNGREVWSNYYAPRHAVNLGIGSDHTQHVLWRLEHGNLEGLAPKVAVVLIGVNNVPDEGNSPSDILAGVNAVVGKLRSSLPGTKILLLGIFPFREGFNWQRGKALQINQALERTYRPEREAETRVHYMDIGALFINEDGRIPREMMRDFLHPSPQGYKLWAEAMEPTLAKMLGENGKKE